MSTPHVRAAVAAVAVLGFTLKAAGPAYLGGRDLPPRTRSVLALTASALLAGFVTVQLAGPGWTGLDPAVVAGVAGGSGLRLSGAPLPLVMVGAVAVSAALRRAY